MKLAAWKRLVCVFALLPLAVAAQTADKGVLSPLNDQFPEWFRLSGEYRIRAEGYEGGAYTAGNNEGYLLGRLQMNMRIRLKGLQIFVQGQDARVLGNDTIPDAFPYQDHFDLRQAYLQLGDVEKGRFAVRAGRQELAFGEQRILGIANWLNTPRSFDAVRGTLNYGRLRIDAFAASVVSPVEGVFDHHRDGEDLHGIYTVISRVIPGATIEPYFLWHLGGGFRTEAGAAARRDTRTYALRIARKPGKSFDYVAHFLGQAGHLGSDGVRAYAMNVNFGYSWGAAVWKPRVFADYAYASGDGNAHDNRSNTFDQIYPSNHGLYGAVDLFGFRNLRDLKAGLDLKPMKKLVITPVVHNLYLANSHDGIYNGPGNLVVRKADGSAGTHIGQEVEATATYSLTSFLSSGTGYGHLFPGGFIEKATKGSPQNIAYLFFTFSF